MATYERIDYGSPDGSQWGGAATGKLGCYGVTPVVQYPSVGAASTYATQQVSTATNSTWGFASALEMSSFVRQVSNALANPHVLFVAVETCCVA